MGSIVLVDQCWHCLRLTQMKDLVIEYEYTIDSHEQLVKSNEVKKICKECKRLYSLVEGEMK